MVSGWKRSGANHSEMDSICPFFRSIRYRIGMPSSKFFITANEDRAATSFEIADRGIVSNLHDIVSTLS